MNPRAKYLPPHWQEWVANDPDLSEGKLTERFNGDVEIIFEDRSTAKFKYAFAVENPDRKEICVFTEHCGYHVYALPLKWCICPYQGTWHNRSKELSKLPRCVRLAGYLEADAKYSYIGAKLRHSGRKDETWTEDESMLFDDGADELDVWWHALTDEEHEFLKSIELLLAALCRGEDPMEKYEKSK